MPQAPVFADVFGFPRTGFSLLISIIHELYDHHRIVLAAPDDGFKKINHEFITSVDERIADALNSLGVDNELIFNENFKHLLGGPNWIDQTKQTLCIRKYIGFKDLGDMTIIISLPLSFLDFHRTPHSHGPLEEWLKLGRNRKVFNSIRSPAGTINSAVHSINALTSEYIQKWYSGISPEEEEFIRTELAISKLSDLRFFEALLRPMKASFEELVKYKDRVCLFRWEDMIINPIQSIIDVSGQLNLVTDESTAEKIWDKIGNRNLTNAHKHNYRQFGTKIDGHLRTLTNHHIKLLDSYGFAKISKILGVGGPECINESEYTDFQMRLSASLNKGEVIKYTENRELYWLSFQKTNIDFSLFGFKVYDWKHWSKLERTNIKDDRLISAIWQIYEELVPIYVKKLNNCCNSSSSSNLR